MKKNILYILILPFIFGFMDCQKREESPKEKLKKKLEKRAKIATPRCQKFCEKAKSLCREFLKKKKRNFSVKKCMRGCVGKFLVNTFHISKRLHCSEKAKTCDEIRSCNRCGNIICPKTEGKKSKENKEKLKNKVHNNESKAEKK